MTEDAGMDTMDALLYGVVSSSPTLKEYVQALQVTGVQVLIILVGPVLYMAFLHIAHMLTYPFGDQSYHLPTETYIDRLDDELKQMAQQRAWMKEKTRNLALKS